MKIGIVILNYSGHDDTVDCLSSLSKITTAHDVKVVVVDNGSKEEQVPQIANSKSQTVHVELLRNTVNKGFSGGNNVGIEYCMKDEAEAVILLNNDTFVSPDFIDRLVMASKHNDHQAIIGPKIYFAAGYEFHKEKYKKSEQGNVIWYAGGVIDWKNVYASHRGVDEVDKGQYDEASKTAFVTGCCMFIPKNIIQDIGMLDEAYFLYYEDVDYCMRARRKGHELWYEPSAHIWHKNARSSGSSGSDLQIYYQTRNRLLFGMRYAPVRTRVALIRESMSFFTQGGERRNAVVDYFMGKLGKRYSNHFRGGGLMSSVWIPACAGMT